MKKYNLILSNEQSLLRQAIFAITLLFISTVLFATIAILLINYGISEAQSTLYSLIIVSILSVSVLAILHKYNFSHQLILRKVRKKVKDKLTYWTSK